MVSDAAARAWWEVEGGGGDVGFGVGDDATFKVSEDGVFGGGAEDVLWEEGDFSAAAREIDDVLGDTETAEATAQGFHDLDTARDGCAEVFDALDEIALVEVVGFDASAQELTGEVFEDIGMVVDAA